MANWLREYREAKNQVTKLILKLNSFEAQENAVKKLIDENLPFDLALDKLFRKLKICSESKEFMQKENSFLRAEIAKGLRFIDDDDLGAAKNILIGSLRGLDE